MNAASQLSNDFLPVCGFEVLVPNSGVALLVEGRQIALFYLPAFTPQLYAIGNFDPLGQANVLSRGIVGDVNGRLCVASPLYKQHFDLRNGGCIEDTAHTVPTYEVRLREGQVWLKL